MFAAAIALISVLHRLSLHDAYMADGPSQFGYACWGLAHTLHYNPRNLTVLHDASGPLAGVLVWLQSPSAIRGEVPSLSVTNKRLHEALSLQDVFEHNSCCRPCSSSISLSKQQQGQQGVSSPWTSRQ